MLLMMLFILTKITLKLPVNIFIRSVQGMGVKKGGALNTLRVPDQILREQGHQRCYGCTW